jgi:hypothetical protein
MKKLKLVIILLFLLFLKQLHCEPNYLKLIIPEQTFQKDELCYKTNEDYNLLRGILPSAQVFFNIIPEVPVALTFDAKTKNSDSNLFSSKTKIFEISIPVNNSVIR